MGQRAMGARCKVEFRRYLNGDYDVEAIYKLLKRLINELTRESS